MSGTEVLAAAGTPAELAKGRDLDVARVIGTCGRACYAAAERRSGSRRASAVRSMT